MFMVNWVAYCTASVCNHNRACCCTYAHDNEWPHRVNIIALNMLHLFTAPAASGGEDTDKKEKAQKGGTAVKVTTKISILYKNII